MTMETESPQDTQPQSRWRRWSRRAVLELGYLVFLLVLLEAMLRLAGWIWLVPRNLSQGPTNPNDSEIRILAIGESTTFGQGVSPEDAYPKQLERMLNDGSDKIYRVINTGVPGQTSTSILRNIRYQMETYRPQFVLALFGINDTNEALNDLSARVAFGFNVPEWVADLRIYRLACIVRDYALHHPKVEEHGAWTFFDRDQRGEDGAWVDNPFFLEQLKRNTAEIIEIVRSEGADYAMLSYLKSNEPLRKVLVEIAEENDVLYIDLFDEEAGNKGLFTADGFHPNEEGHRVMAEKIYEGLLENESLGESR
ncbi:MAG: hypothetical protein H6752_11595 [Candidatus Omnitrophica bacterium]|nr:hypothetical protein [Candidatus Omnitrophota bacterium]